MFCTKCGSEVSNDSTFCPKCGTATSQTQKPSNQTDGTRDQKKADLIYPKDPPKSLWLSAWALLFPGIPQIIIGQVAKGLMMIAITLVLFFILPDAASAIGLGTAFYSLFDARKALKTLKSGHPITKWDNKPAQ